MSGDNINKLEKPKIDGILIVIRLALWSSLILYGATLYDIVGYKADTSSSFISGANYMIALALVGWLAVTEYVFHRENKDKHGVVKE